MIFRSIVFLVLVLGLHSSANAGDPGDTVKSEKDCKEVSSGTHTCSSGQRPIIEECTTCETYPNGEEICNGTAKHERCVEQSKDDSDTDAN